MREPVTSTLRSITSSYRGAAITTISPALRDFAKQVFSGALPYDVCEDCGGIHRRTCPRVASIVWRQDADGRFVERHVTYWPNGQWEDGIIFPEDVYEPDDAEAGDGAAGQVPGV